MSLIQFDPFLFTSLSLDRGRAVHSLLSALHTIHDTTFSQPCLNVWQCFRVLLSAHTLQRQLSMCSRRVSLSVRSYSPPLRIRRRVPLNTRWDTAETKAAAHWGAFWDTFLTWKSSLKTWLTQSSNLSSHDAVLDLFNFCIVLYVRFRYFLEFTFCNPRLLFLLEKEDERTFGNKRGGMLRHSVSKR